MDIYHVIKRPLITEKGTHQSKVSHEATKTRAGRGGAYSFEVHPTASKIEIRDAIEKIYKVRVEAVRTCTRRGKTRRYRGRPGVTKHWKKAVVVLQPDFHIDLF
ncbi:MAG TPA: 50S ribosomal protein L23 [Phycisphaerae bacterium]|nr:50S ribosomal protein L23 [Phycisphaerae bacterium]